MIIELAIHITPERIQIQHADKGMLINLRNNAAYDPVKGSILTLGKSPEELAEKLPLEQRAGYLENTQFTAPFSVQGFADGLARPVLVYLVEKAQARFYANRWSNALNVVRDTLRVNLEIDAYAAIPPEQRQAFEDAISPLWQTTLNGTDLSEAFRQGKTARRVYLWINLVVLAALVLLLVEIGSLSAELVPPGDTVGFILGLILVYAAALAILYLGTFLSRIVWILALRKRMPGAVLKAQMEGDRRIQSSLPFIKQWLAGLIGT